MRWVTKNRTDEKWHIAREMDKLASHMVSTLVDIVKRSTASATAPRMWGVSTIRDLTTPRT